MDRDLAMKSLCMKMNACWKRCVVLLLLVWSASRFDLGVDAWGADGHRMTCLIAEPLLSSSAAKAVKHLLPHHAPDLASLCTWPDDIRHQWKWHWSSPLHFIDTPDFLCGYNYNRDCHNPQGEKGMCVAGAINNYTSQLLTYRHTLALELSGPGEHLLSTRPSHYNLTEALLFLAHFVGDIHQPLHVGFTSDLGGNTIIVHWYRRKSNLHHVWDDDIINSAKEKYYDSENSKMIEAIKNSIDNEWSQEKPGWTDCKAGELPCPDTYAVESIQAACKFAYRNATPGSVLEDDYFLSRLPVLQKRLAQGGVRLAALLNHIFAENSRDERRKVCLLNTLSMDPSRSIEFRMILKVLEL